MTPVKIFGLIGNPVEHSLSCLMHNAAFKALKINAEYKLFRLETKELEHFLFNLNNNNIFGLNVTVPYKEKVMPLLDSVSQEAKLIGAVNTIKVSENNLEGFNTDGEGFIKDLKEGLGFNPAGKSISILGAGGAAKAVSVYLSKEAPKTISIFDIDKQKKETLVSNLKSNFENVDFRSVDSIESLKINDCDLLVNATPVGLQDEDPCLIDEKFINENTLVYDLIYNPKQTKLLKIAEEKGARTACGLGMLLYQGALSFKIWTQKEAPVRVMRQALEEGVRRL